MFILVLCITIFFVFCLQITVQKHTMVCKACNSYVHNTNDMTLLHINICCATGMEESPKVTLDIQCLQRGGGAALPSTIN